MDVCSEWHGFSAHDGCSVYGNPVHISTDADAKDDSYFAADLIGDLLLRFWYICII